MEQNKEIGGKDSFSTSCRAIASAIITVALILLTAVYPLIYDDSYFNILETKYRYYYIPVLGMLGLLLLLGIVACFIDAKEFGWEHSKRLLSVLKPKNWKEHFSIADGAAFLFWVICLISTFQSDYFYESFWGNEGRCSGLFLLTLYAASYFAISCLWKTKGWIFQIFLLSGMIMCGIGITDYFRMDILNFRRGINPDQVDIFTSTVGNINTYTAYVALLMGFSTAMFLVEHKLWKKIWYYLCMVVSFVAIIMGCSDNAYLALGGMFASLPFVAFRSRKYLGRYLIVLASFMTVIQGIDWINQKFEDEVIGLDSLFQVFSNFDKLLLVVGLSWVLVIAYYMFAMRGENRENEIPGSIWLSRGWIVALLLVVFVVAFVFYDANIAGNGERYASLSKYVIFNDAWGTKRGYIWKRTIKMYQELPVLHRIFGFGPDTFGILTVYNIFQEMVDITGEVFDNAHNAYLQYLITIGPIGLGMYLLLLISGIVQMLKRSLANPYAIGCAFAVLCYAMQAIVNLDLPIVTPMMWLLLSIGMGIVRDSLKKAVS